MCVFNDYRLTGGIFFALFLDSMSKTRLSPRARRKSKGIIQNEVLRDLFRVFNPSFEYYDYPDNENSRSNGGIKTRCSTFKKCATDDREFFLYDAKEDIIISKESVLSDCKEYLTRFDDFLNNYRIVSAHAKPFVYRLLALLSFDDSIPNDELLYVQGDGTALKKSELLKCDTITYDSFLFGIWLFVCFRDQPNSIGAATYDYFWKPRTESGSVRDFVDSNPHLGDEFAEINVLFAERMNDGIIGIEAEPNITDISQSEIIPARRSLSETDSALFHKLQCDFDSLLPFCICANPFKKGVFDNGEVASIKELIEKWRSICPTIVDQPFIYFIQGLVELLEEYVSFYSDPHVVCITKKKMRVFTPCFKDDDPELFVLESVYNNNHRQLRSIYETIYMH